MNSSAVAPRAIESDRPGLTGRNESASTPTHQRRPRPRRRVAVNESRLARRRHGRGRVRMRICVGRRCDGRGLGQIGSTLRASPTTGQVCLPPSRRSDSEFLLCTLFASRRTAGCDSRGLVGGRRPPATHLRTRMSCKVSEFDHLRHQDSTCMMPAAPRSPAIGDQQPTPAAVSLGPRAAPGEPRSRPTRPSGAGGLRRAMLRVPGCRRRWTSTGRPPARSSTQRYQSRAAGSPPPRSTNRRPRRRALRPRPSRRPSSCTRAAAPARATRARC